MFYCQETDLKEKRTHLSEVEKKIQLTLETEENGRYSATSGHCDHETGMVSNTKCNEKKQTVKTTFTIFQHTVKG